jgi:hypothetical protein
MLFKEEVDEQGENFDKGQQEEELRLPSAICGYSYNVLHNLGQEATLKLDLMIMPTLYILNHLNGQNVAAAYLASITEDLGLSVTLYQRFHDGCYRSVRMTDHCRRQTLRMDQI